MSETKVRPFGMKDKMGYLFGDLGNDLTFILSSSYLMKFYTDIMGVDGGVVGIVMMVARFVDAFTDVTMGRIADKSKPTPAGKFKPWIRRMCGPVAVASFLIYQSAFADYPMTFKIVWLFVTYILWGSVFYTSINIPYGSMASMITNDPTERQSLSTFRTVGGTLSGVVMGILVPMIAYETVNGQKILVGSKFTTVAGICSILAVVCYLLCYNLTIERVKADVAAPEAKTEKQSIMASFATMVKKLVTNKALVTVIISSIFMLLAQLTVQGMMNYVYPNVYNDTTALSAFSLLIVVVIMISAVLAKPLVKKFGRKEVSTFGAVFSVAAYLICFIVRPTNVWVYVAFSLLAYFGLGLFSVLSWALITDVIDYSEILNGEREDGTIYAVYSFARKLGQAASAGLVGGILSMIGYSAETAFDPEVLEAIFNTSCLVPALGFAVVALVLGFAYPLNKKMVDKNTEILAQKHSQN